MNLKILIICNILLLILLYIIPKPKTEETQIKEEIISAEVIQVTTRYQDTPRKSKNLTITVNSDLRNTSNLTAEEFDKMLEGTNLYGLGEALEKAEQEYSINGLYLMGLACLESGYGTSSYAINRNNLVGWNAVDSNSNKASYFESKLECILYVAGKLKTNYLSENGKYFNGYTAKAIDIKYCSDSNHADKIISIVNKLVKKL